MEFNEEELEKILDGLYLLQLTYMNNKDLLIEVEKINLIINEIIEVLKIPNYD